MNKIMPPQLWIDYEREIIGVEIKAFFPNIGESNMKKVMLGMLLERWKNVSEIDRKVWFDHRVTIGTQTDIVPKPKEGSAKRPRFEESPFGESPFKKTRI